jgi:tRNA-modifying protein YgfZ
MTVAAYARIDVSGADALPFLQAQLTNDLRRLADGQRILAAWCNPKGRVICLFRVGRHGQGFSLALPAELADPVLKRLAMFRFRSKVEFAPGADAAGLLADEAPAAFDLPAWQQANLLKGIPEIGAAQSEQYTPHMLNLDRLDALSLDKGCYTGQEVIARTHYRGASKRRTRRFVAAAPVAEGDDVRAGEKKAGAVLNAIGTDLLAVLSLELAGADSLTAGGIALTPAPVPYERD